MKINRRTFLGGIASAGMAFALPARRAEAAINDDSYTTLIDLTKCDGCKNNLSKDGMPQCVAGCRTENAARFPEPDKAMLKPYWPQEKFEDWSSPKKRKIISRLTPYNWIFVQKLKVNVDGKEEEVNVPRRCMHCDNPPCVKLCPFGALHKTSEGPTYIDDSICFGGAKCRTVCPWDVPQRQAGVGLYTHLDPMPVGGGVMYKCDLCRGRLKKGQKPACIDACPNNAMMLGFRKEIFIQAEKLRKQYKGYIYGKDENSGTSTIYVSKIPFEKIDAAIIKKSKARKQKKAMRMKKEGNMLEKYNGLSIASLLAPLAGAFTALALTLKKGAAKEEDKEAKE